MQKSVPATTIRRPRRRQGGARQRRHYNQPGARNDESKLQEPERGKWTKEESKEQEQKDKEDESKPTDSSKLQQVSKQETGKKTPGARARRKESSKTKVGRLAAGLGLVG